MMSFGHSRSTLLGVGWAIGVGAVACSGVSPGTEMIAPADDSSAETSTASGAEAGAVPFAGSFQLSGGGVTVRFGSSGGVPYLTYDDAQWSHTYTGSEITFTPSGAGTLVSVTTRFTIDSGTTTFSVLVPRFRLPPNGAAVPAVTQGITTVHQFSVRPETGQLDVYAFTPLTGTLGSIDRTF